MSKKSYFKYDKDKKDVDLHEVHELIEMGLNKEEIAKEFGISTRYVKKVMQDYYDDY
ncbi:hypothetical protein K8M07_01680 [Schnuerera sp. xch1]|uniref:hypothetical protein n=1 Tax=Schnuerera sp. xch1 TaxID=2874283 RepID=UPI001CBA9CC9|nr:hypothetical protein [Schnuerera sp. xch1]MBZ2173964.1 hypothetical protein [Schnuerera sp. xch1]